MSKKKKKLKITKLEKKLYSLAIFSFTLTILLKIFCGAGIGHLSMSVEQMKSKIDKQNNKNESLNRKINELTSFDKIKEVVADMGLAYNNDNIVVIND